MPTETRKSSKLHIELLKQFKNSRTFTNFIKPLLPKYRTEQFLVCMYVCIYVCFMCLPPVSTLYFPYSALHAKVIQLCSNSAFHGVPRV